MDIFETITIFLSNLLTKGLFFFFFLRREQFRKTDTDDVKFWFSFIQMYIGTPHARTHIRSVLQVYARTNRAIPHSLKK